MAAALGYLLGARTGSRLKGLLGGGKAAIQEQRPSPAAEKPAASGKKERRILYYRNPMNPSITSPVPAKDEMGMDYIPVYADELETSRPAGTVRIDPVMVQKIGVRVAKAQCRVLKREVTAPGRVEYDAERLWSVHSRFQGWAEEVFVAKVGDVVEAGDPLLSIYSPELVATEQEFLLALASPGGGLLDAARERLRLFGVPQDFVRELERSRRVKRAITLRSPGTGTVIDVGVLPGDFITPKTRLYRICDLSRLWIIAEVYDQDLPWIGKGDRAVVGSPVFPGRRLEASVDFVYPEMDRKARTVPVRLVVDNKRGLLRPGMFVDVTILAGRRRRALVVPSEAVVRSGKEARVFVQTEPGVFEPRRVVLGLEAQGMVEVLSGIRHGDPVVTSAQFLIDSESRLKEAAAKMMRSGLAAGGKQGQDKGAGGEGGTDDGHGEGQR